MRVMSVKLPGRIRTTVEGEESEGMSQITKMGRSTKDRLSECSDGFPVVLCHYDMHEFCTFKDFSLINLHSSIYQQPFCLI